MFLLNRLFTHSFTQSLNFLTLLTYFNLLFNLLAHSIHLLSLFTQFKHSFLTLTHFTHLLASLTDSSLIYSLTPFTPSITLIHHSHLSPTHLLILLTHSLCSPIHFTHSLILLTHSLADLLNSLT